MDVERDDDQPGSSRVVDDAAYAAQLQRQFDDEDMLTAKLNASCGFGMPAFSQPINAEEDAAIARRMQREFYMDMKRQGMSDLDIMSMMDTMSKDDEMERAIKASLGELVDTGGVRRSCVSDYLLTLQNNAVYEMNVQPHAVPLEFVNFREEVKKSVQWLVSNSLISVEEVIVMIGEYGVTGNVPWNHKESVYFIIGVIVDQVKVFPSSNPSLDSLIVNILNDIVSIPYNSNPLLLQTVCMLIQGMGSIIMDKAHISRCIGWLLKIPPFETILPQMAATLGKICLTSTPDDISADDIMSLLPYTDLSPTPSAEMDDAANNIVYAAACVVSTRHLDVVPRLEKLLEEPLLQLDKISQGLPNVDLLNAKDKHNVDPCIWLKRIVFVLSPIQKPNPLISTNMQAVPQPSPLVKLCHTVWEKLVPLFTSYATNDDVIGLISKVAFQLVYKNKQENKDIFTSLLENLVIVFRQICSLSAIMALETVVDEFTISYGVEFMIGEVFNHFFATALNRVPSVQQQADGAKLYKHLFSVLNGFIRMRFTAFARTEAFPPTYRLAVSALKVQQEGLYAEARCFVLMSVQFVLRGDLSEENDVGDVVGVVQAAVRDTFEELVWTACDNVLNYRQPLLSESGAITLKALRDRNEEVKPLMDSIERYVNHRLTNLSAQEKAELMQSFYACQSHDEIMNVVNSFMQNLRL